MYITEEWFRMDLLRSYVMTVDTDAVAVDNSACETDCGRPCAPVAVKGSCEAYDTSYGPTGKEGQVTEFSW